MKALTRSLMVVGALASSSAAAQSDHYAPGSRAQNFTLEDKDGHNVSLRDYDSGRVVVDFAASWCVPCKNMAAGAPFAGVPYLVVLVQNERGEPSTREDARRWSKMFNLDGSAVKVLHLGGATRGDVWKQLTAYGDPEGSFPTLAFIENGRVKDSRVGQMRVVEIEQVFDPGAVDRFPTGEPTPLGLLAVDASFTAMLVPDAEHGPLTGPVAAGSYASDDPGATPWAFAISGLSSDGGDLGHAKVAGAVLGTASYPTLGLFLPDQDVTVALSGSYKVTFASASPFAFGVRFLPGGPVFEQYVGAPVALGGVAATGASVTYRLRSFVPPDAMVYGVGLLDLTYDKPLD